MSVRIKSENIDGLEISWFAPLCDGDDEFLGERSDQYRSSWENASQILYRAEQNGFENILCPSSYQVGLDTLSFASAVAPNTHKINLLPAIRCGEIHPPMLARSIATLDHILKGRLTLNIISSNLPGTDMESSDRYRRSEEVIQILKQAWTQDAIDFEGEFYNLQLDSRPAKPYQVDGPLLYFGGYSPDGVDLCARHCDVYLMWPDVEAEIEKHMVNMTEKAAGYGRTVDFGLRVHVIVRETESEAREAAGKLISKLDVKLATDIKHRALDAKSYGVSLQDSLRNQSDEEGYAEANLWTKIGMARSGCGAALVGDPDQIVEKIKRYQAMGIRAFIFSGYPHLEACDWFGKLVMPQLKTTQLNKEMGKVPTELPLTPLAAGNRF